MSRLAYYAGISTAAAGGVIASAFVQRANFYSACVYLAQSNLCLMILLNLILFIYGSFMFGLQRLCYGPLRPIETEQLYEKAWFAITETCLAMTIFREEVGAWFLVMFVALLTGKVWGWIGHGRVEVLEQQPPANPRLFHIRLSISLGLSVLYDVWMMSYTINTVIRQARPNMMVMYLFEFAVLTTNSLSTGFRYIISLTEARIIKKQTQDRLLERRREIREERAQMIRQREAAAAEGTGLSSEEADAPLPSEDDVDEMDFDIQWEAKGQWILTLDLLADLVKLIIYIVFFLILFMFYGLPIHIMRDLFLTGRSFFKRLGAYWKYRKATSDMNRIYPDATVEEIQPDDVCIVCREEMRPWSVTNPHPPNAAPGAIPPARSAATVNERSRPKKLPCGHIFHLGCLKSWFERQQACPTCRAPAVNSGNGVPAARAGAANVNQPPGAPGAQPPPGQQDGAAPPPPAPANGRGAMRMLNLGPLRVGFGHGNLDQMMGQAGQAAGPGPRPRVYGLEFGLPGILGRRPRPPQAPDVAMNNEDIPGHLQQIELYIAQEIRSLQLSQQQLETLHLLRAELSRLRALQNGEILQPVIDPLRAGIPPLIAQNQLIRPIHHRPQMQRHGAVPGTTAIPAGSAELPPGVVIPEGWSLLPLQRLDQGPPPPGIQVANPAPASFSTPDVMNRENRTASSPQVPIHPVANSIGTENTGPILRSTESPGVPNTRIAQSGDDNSASLAVTPEGSTAGPTGLSESTTDAPERTTIGSPAMFGSATENHDRIPNWGSSNLFSGTTLTPQSNQDHVGSASGVVANSAHVGIDADSEAATNLAQDAAEGSSRDKGAARAATVEDAEE